MAPTVCLAEFPATGSTVNTCMYQRTRIQNGANAKRWTSALERMLRTGIVGQTPPTSREDHSWKSECKSTSNYFVLPDRSGEFSVDVDYLKLITAKRDLLNIVVRTISLLQRNRILQKRVNELHAETRWFLRSILNNPENRCQQQDSRMSEPEGEIVSSSTDGGVLTSSSQCDVGSTQDSFHGIVDTPDNRDRDRDECSLDKSDDSSRSEC